MTLVPLNFSELRREIPDLDSESNQTGTVYDDESNFIDDPLEEIHRWEVPYFKPESEKRQKYMNSKGTLFTKVLNIMNCCGQR